jgi:CRISPR-associated endonuclease/helicase Cas3
MNRPATYPSYFKYWGKARKETGLEGKDYHLLIFHCLDVAAVADVWMQKSNVLLSQIASELKLSNDETRATLLFYILLHDLGKFDARFQHFREDIRVFLQGDQFEVDADLTHYSHGSYGYHHFRKEFHQSEPMKAVAGHHGHCDLSIRYSEPDADDELIAFDRLARKEWIEFCLDWLGLDEIPRVGEVSLLAGFCSVADWIGSSITNFTIDPTTNLKDYYQDALSRGEAALLESGVLGKLAGAGFNYLFPGYVPRGIQTLIEKIPVETGLTIVESDTGSGKTEFALAYASLLIQAHLADGVVFGLPTQATANGLFNRVGIAAKALFPDSSVTLAHSKAKYLFPDEDGFLHLSSKRAFLGSMSVATVDQILMGVLGIKHQFVRSFGTRKSVLILDEIHSFDAYMYGLIEQVLKGQHKAYSSVILLSATLSKSLKNKLLLPYGGKATKDAYPLVTHTDIKGNTREFEIKDSQANIKEKIIRAELWLSDNLLPTPTQMNDITDWVNGGAMVCVICNTVNDAQQLYLSFLEKGLVHNLDLFHARFTFGDRDRIEKNILKNYDKNAIRIGRLLIATQVVEQSLDLDFDIMISQVAPIEFLMQRMGRLWRHNRIDTELCPRSDYFTEPKFITLLPMSQVTDWKRHYQGTGFVYSNIRVLYRTQQYLSCHSQLAFPNCYRDAIEYVHALDAYEGEPDELDALNEEYVRGQEGSLYAARMNSNLDSKPLSDVDPRCAMLTREGEMSATVIIFKKNGELLHGGDFDEQFDRERSTVSIAKKHAKGTRDDTYHCIKSVLGRDVQYSEIGVLLSTKNKK